MEVGIFEQQEIERYFFLDYDIKQTERRIRETREEFYDQSMATRTTYNDIALICVGFDAETNVIPFIDVIAAMEKRLEKQYKRKRYFDDYLNSLDPADRSYLINRYQNGIGFGICQIDKDLYAEILEINEAINHMEGYPVEVTQEEINEHSKNITDQVSFMAEVLGV